MTRSFRTDATPRTAAVFLLVALLAHGAAAQVAPRAAASPLAAAERAAASALSEKTIRHVTEDLSAPGMEGRGTALPGGDKAAHYIADRFQHIGMKPLGDGATFLQAVRFRSAEVGAESAIVIGKTSLSFGRDFVVAPPFPTRPIDVSAGVVFAGYGVVEPALERDDLATLDLTGKVVVVIGGTPRGVDKEAWKKAAGMRDVGARLVAKGAAAVLLVPSAEDAASFAQFADYLSRRRVGLADAPKTAADGPPALLVARAAAERLFEAAGVNLADIEKRLSNGEMASRELGVDASVTVHVRRAEGIGSNVVGVIEGTDPKLKSEAVVFSAHYDAYGPAGGGKFYSGAADNAIGVGEMMAIAQATAGARPRRSVIFMAVTAEEYGMLGSGFWVDHPTWPADKIAADVNFDGIGTEIYGPVKSIIGFGGEFSDLGAVLEGVTVATGTKVIPDPMPEERAFYRSDQYAFVRAGIPGINILGAPDGDPKPWVERANHWLETDYHQTTDTIRPDWDWGGARTVAVVGLLVVLRVANADAMSAWLPGAPFKRKPKA